MLHRRKHVRCYGAIWDESQSSPTLERIGQGKSSQAATKLPDNLMVLQSKMRSCLMNDAGEVQYYTGAADRTKKEDGVTSSVLTGEDGQVMVEIPLGWLKYWYINSKHHYLISKEQFNGAFRLNAFYKNDKWVRNRYIAAYEGISYDVSASRYTNGVYFSNSSLIFDSSTKTISDGSYNHPFTRLEVGDKIDVLNSNSNNGTFTVASVGNKSFTVSESLTTESGTSVVLQTQKDWTVTTGDKLSSVSGKTPITCGTRANFRVAAKNRGIGWRQQDYDLVSVIQLLYLVEYASWNSQSMIGDGLTNFGVSNWSHRNYYNPIEVTGLSNNLGNTSGGVDNGGNSLGSYMSYRGIENFFGHEWKWVDGINIGGPTSEDNYKVHVCNNDVNFADDTWTNYTDLGIVLVNSEGWQKTLKQIARGFLPANSGGSSSTYITDKSYLSSGWRAVSIGGTAAGGAIDGVACWNLENTSGSFYTTIVGRLSC